MSSEELKLRRKLYKTLQPLSIMPKEGSSNAAIASVILGVISIVFSLSVLFGQGAGIALGIIGFIFALVARNDANKKWANWGLALSIIGIALNLIILIYLYQAIIEVVNQLEVAAAQFEAAQGSIDQLNEIAGAAA
ncbi:hypothetical protein CMI48_02710 [Candidatus Pacearchaeota archaeon]|nr:hypothetical protein [Candidatus Pacearchaeota archaeon]